MHSKSEMVDINYILYLPVEGMEKANIEDIGRGPNVASGAQGNRSDLFSLVFRGLRLVRFIMTRQRLFKMLLWEDDFTRTDRIQIRNVVSPDGP